MTVLKFYEQSPEKQKSWIKQMSSCDWDAGRYLGYLLDKNEFKSCCGKDAQVYLLTDGEKLVSYCTLAEHDEIFSDNMKPWIGFVYTFPEYRGKRCSGKLIECAVKEASEAGFESVFVSSEEKGLYEKYGFSYVTDMESEHGYMTQVFERKIK